MACCHSSLFYLSCLSCSFALVCPFLPENEWTSWILPKPHPIPSIRRWGKLSSSLSFFLFIWWRPAKIVTPGWIIQTLSTLRLIQIFFSQESQEKAQSDPHSKVNLNLKNTHRQNSVKHSGLTLKRHLVLILNFGFCGAQIGSLRKKLLDNMW